MTRELLGLLVPVHQRTEQVGRQQVGRELNPAETGVDGLSQRRDGQRLGQSRNALEQNMPVRQQPDQQRVDQMLLPDDHLAHFQIQRVDEDARALDPLVEFLDVDYLAHISMIKCCVSPHIGRLPKEAKRFLNG